MVYYFGVVDFVWRLFGCESGVDFVFSVNELDFVRDFIVVVFFMVVGVWCGYVVIWDFVY